MGTIEALKPGFTSSGASALDRCCLPGWVKWEERKENGFVLEAQIMRLHWGHGFKSSL